MRRTKQEISADIKRYDAYHHQPGRHRLHHHQVQNPRPHPPRHQCLDLLLRKLIEHEV